MRALVVYCHPRQGSFNEAIRDLVLEKLNASGAETRLCDLYARGFNPVMSAHDHEIYEDEAINQSATKEDCDNLGWCDTLIFVYPTWWYGPPAMLKGWLDRVMVPGLAFVMPRSEGDTIQPGLQHIKRLGVFTTCGASWWLTRVIGAPGRRTLMRGVGFICAKNRRSVFAAHYLMDSSTDASRAKHLARVSRKMDKLIGGR